MNKPAQVVMLPSNEKATVNSIVTRPSDNRMATVNVLTKDDPQLCIHQHLYILSDEEIKRGDWCYDEYNKVIFQNNSSGTPGASKKIIATTDMSLTFAKDSFGKHFQSSIESQNIFVLPQPSQSFIEKFVEEYNKGNVITKVMVEYEDKIAMDGHTIIGQELKINPDNTINISMPKDSWNREEVKQLFDKWNDIVYKGYYMAKKDLETVLDYSDKWIEENL